MQSRGSPPLPWVRFSAPPAPPPRLSEARLSTDPSQDRFYSKYGVKFFKDRHWLRREVSELMPAPVRASPLTWCPPLATPKECRPDQKLADIRPTASEVAGKLIGVEAGCGCGSAAFPLLRANKDVFLLACDSSKEAIALLKSRDDWSTTRRIYAWVADVAAESNENWLWVESLANEIGGLDFVTIIYVLSAIDRTHMQRAVQRLARLLKVGGLLFFRDYAAGDMAQHRFDARGAKNKLDSETYARGEGTLAHYFTHDEIRSLFEHDGMLEQKQLITVEREISNRKLDITMHRKWIQAKFVRRSINRPATSELLVSTFVASPRISLRDEDDGLHSPFDFARTWCHIRRWLCCFSLSEDQESRVPLASGHTLV